MDSYNTDDFDYNSPPHTLVVDENTVNLDVSSLSVCETSIPASASLSDYETDYAYASHPYNNENDHSERYKKQTSDSERIGYDSEETYEKQIYDNNAQAYESETHEKQLYDVEACEQERYDSQTYEKEPFTGGASNGTNSNDIQGVLQEITTGGYKKKFLDNVEDFLCSICTDVLREPVQTICGHCYCESCWNPWASEHRAKIPCPICKKILTPNDIRPDRKQERMIGDLLVFCDNEEHGCNWTIELRYMTDHLKECAYEMVSCDNNCGKKMARRELQTHMERECPKIYVTYEGGEPEMLSNLQENSNHFSLRAMKSDIEELRNITIQQSAKIKQLQEIVNKMSCAEGIGGKKDDVQKNDNINTLNLEGNHNFPFLWEIQLKKGTLDQSPPLYTRQRLKMFLQAEIIENSKKSKKRNNVTTDILKIDIINLHGRFDFGDARWPYVGRISVKVVDVGTGEVLKNESSNIEPYSSESRMQYRERSPQNRFLPFCTYKYYLNSGSKQYAHLKITAEILWYL